MLPLISCRTMSTPAIFFYLKWFSGRLPVWFCPHAPFCPWLLLVNTSVLLQSLPLSWLLSLAPPHLYRVPPPWCIEAVLSLHCFVTSDVRWNPPCCLLLPWQCPCFSPATFSASSPCCVSLLFFSLFPVQFLILSSVDLCLSFASHSPCTVLVLQERRSGQINHV